MRKRFLSTVVLTFALILSAWGNVLAAALCPHMGQDHACCHAQLAHHPRNHHEMAGMQMDEMQTEPVAEQRTEANAFSQLAEPCEHCMSHSQLATSSATLREADQTKRGEDVAAPHALSKSMSIATSFVTVVPAREHSPPCASLSARHVLISIFRI
ncbi:MAG: hypothetical protein AUG51_19150 [Acidobacteria bacterium 13_1_20CM_3_53_8]|nr:MAG: hypothetical protein AUG51_19150 [Acidobacteria bacterium 13_1_20CM_3_53_8]